MEVSFLVLEWFENLMQFLQGCTKKRDEKHIFFYLVLLHYLVVLWWGKLDSVVYCHLYHKVVEKEGKRITYKTLNQRL